MADVVFFHSVVGQTEGFLSLAGRLGAGGLSVATPDVFDGRTFPSVEEGMAYVEEIGFGTVIEKAVRSVDASPSGVVYAGVSMGVAAAQRLAQTRSGARGAIFLESCLPHNYFADSWPADLPVQVHGMEADPYFAGDGEIDNARQLVASAADGQLFIYRGDRHLFTDSSLPGYDATATELVVARVMAFLAEHQPAAH